MSSDMMAVVKTEAEDDVGKRMREWMGPLAGDAHLDTFTRHLALDLFVNPAGVRFLAMIMLAKAALQPSYPEMRENVHAVFESVLEHRELDFTFSGVEASSGEAVLQFVPGEGTHVALALKISHLIYGRRVRSLTAIAGLLSVSDAWTHVETAGTHLQSQHTGFRGNAMLRYYYNAHYLAIVMLECLVVDLAQRVPAVGAEETHWRILIHELASILGRYRVREAPQTLEENARDPEALRSAVRTLAHKWKTNMANMGRLLLSHWNRDTQ